jgi:hypothetical protein
MLLNQLRAALAGQFAFLMHVRAEVYDARRKMLVKIDRMKLQFSDFEEHFGNPRAPQLGKGRGSTYLGVSTPGSYS